MMWEAPVVEEMAVGLEVTAYVSAEEDDVLLNASALLDVARDEEGQRPSVA